MKEASRDEAPRSTHTVPRGPEHRPVPVLLRACSGQSAGKTLRLTSGSCVVGAGAVDFRIEDETVSRQHLELELIAEGLSLRDLGSRNGTFFNGHRVERMVLAAGARLRLGKAELSVEFDSNALYSTDGLASYGGLSACSESMKRLFGALRRLEGSLIGVLLSGESGTGKELLVRAIHQHSAVAAGPLVAVNCGSLEHALVRSELFGHRRGAFTGAVETRPGAFQRAQGGTLFLDEVGELPMEVQPVLLRALQEREVVPVGETKPEAVSVRLIAATHRDLEQMVIEGTFREDLYYRLNVIRLEVPPLRERPEDIPLLASELSRRCGIAELPQEIHEQLRAHAWPGNVRELQHAIEAYSVLGELPTFQKRPLRDVQRKLGDHIDVNVPYEALKRELLDTFLEEYLRQLISHTGGNVSKAARLSGLDRSYLNKLVNQHGLR